MNTTIDTTTNQAISAALKPAAKNIPFIDAWEDAAARCRQALPEDAARLARASLFDTAATLAAGARENTTVAAWRSTCRTASTSDLSVNDAALVLGTASHALDYDDVCMIATCHPSAPVFSALLALLPELEARKAAWGDVVGAFALGTETMLRLGQWLGFRHYGLGFHATFTLGAVGAAAAVAQVLKLEPAKARAALSIGASSAGGLRANFGTDTKPLHVGFAAVAGVRAALLADAGATASDDVWTATGFYTAYNGGVPMAALPWKPGMTLALESPGFEIKRFPSCYLTHRIIAGVLKLRERHHAALGDDVRIEVEMPQNAIQPLKYPRPVTGLEGKFSGEYCAATAWVDGRADLRTFADAAVMRAPVRALMERVTLGGRGRDEDLDTAPVRVTIRGGGIEDSINVDWAPGSLADPFTREQLLDKFRDCARHGAMEGAEAAATPILDAPLEAPAAQVLGGLRERLLAATRLGAQP